MMESHDDPSMMYNSTTNSTNTVNEILQDLHTANNKLDTLSAQMQSVAETTANTQSNTSALSRIGEIVLGHNPGQAECDGSNCVLSEEYERTLLERDELALRVRILQDELTAKDKEVDENRGEIRRHLKQVNKLRAIVHDKAGVQKVSDDGIFQAFLWVGRKIRALAKSTALCVSQVPTLEPNASRHVKSFYGGGNWESWRHKDRELRVRNEVFHILHHFILGADCFGIEGYQAGDIERLGPIAAGLSHLEDLAKKKRVSTSVLVNWRVATLECIEALNVQERLSEHVADKLFVFLTPILDKKDLPQAEITLWAQVLELCKDAVKLTVMMRKSRDEYRCEAFTDAGQLPIGAFESWCEPQAVDGGRNTERGDKIAYVLFGALCKNPAYRGENERVLVKAEVVMERKRS